MKLTDTALTKIKEISDSEGIGHYIVRVSIKGAGCSGYSFDMNYDADIKETDSKFEFEDVIIIVDELSSQYMDDVEVDYMESEFSGGFKFSGGAIKSSCGCGNSYSF